MRKKLAQIDEIAKIAFHGSRKTPLIEEALW